MKSKTFEKWVANAESVTAAAKALGISRQLLDYWVVNGIPPKHVLLAQNVTGIPCSTLRPDIYPKSSAA